MTRQYAVAVLRRHYADRDVDPELLIKALNKLNYRREFRARLHPLPADVRARVNMTLLFNLGLAIGQRKAA